ncbi:MULTISPECIES: hypothetical protein [Streptomyces]|uniref:hypothetical protein n=1 Tax=Streptomyces TaxID=1883 RepID=UPI0031E83F4E
MVICTYDSLNKIEKTQNTHFAGVASCADYGCTRADAARQHGVPASAGAESLVARAAGGCPSELEAVVQGDFGRLAGDFWHLADSGGRGRDDDIPRCPQGRRGDDGQAREAAGRSELG